jgi:oligoendopeptidase F
MAVPERGEIDEQYRWDLSSAFDDDEAWAAAADEARDRIDELAAYEGRATEDAATLAELLALREEVFRLVERVGAYARLRHSEDTRDGDAQAMTARASSLRAAAASAIAYLEPALQELGRETLAAYADREPALEAYDHYFDDVCRRAAHTRSPEVESVLAELSEVTDAPAEIYSRLTDADMEFGNVEDPDGETTEITQANFTSLQKEPDRAFRRRVHETFYDRWDDVRNAVGTSLRKAVREHVVSAELRGYDSARAASLDGPNVPPEVYDTLVETVRDELDALGRHAELKRRAIGAETLRPWDLYVPVTGRESPTVPYERARDLVVDAVAPLGDGYRDRMAAGLDSRWVDVYENRGKRSGAFSAGTYDTQPFILMNYQDDVASMYTLAHELGHSMHSELAADAQPWHDADYDIFVAEVASTVNETLLTRHLLSAVDDTELRRHALDEYLERFRSTLFRQTMFADFEHRIHTISEEGGALTPDRLDEEYGDLKREFYANAATGDRIDREWMRIPHFYYNYYVYQYATGISAANAIVESIREEGEPAAERYREFLRTGSREYPLELLEGVGVDMTTAAPIEATIDAYDGYLAEFESLS